MTDRDEFRAVGRERSARCGTRTHNGDAAPRRALWSRNESVNVLGVCRNASGQQEIDELLAALGSSFSECAPYAFEPQAYDVVGDMAYQAGFAPLFRWTVNRAPTRCEPPRSTAAKRASGRSPTARVTRSRVPDPRADRACRRWSAPALLARPRIGVAMQRLPHASLASARMMPPLRGGVGGCRVRSVPLRGAAVRFLAGGAQQCPGRRRIDPRRHP
jgi:hypothetical protein